MEISQISIYFIEIQVGDSLDLAPRMDLYGDSWSFFTHSGIGK